MSSVDANGRLSPHLDNFLGAMVFSMVGAPSVEAQLRYELGLARNSLFDLHSELTALQLKCQSFERKFRKVKEEASLNARALKQQIGELDTLKGNFAQLLKECELYRNDREVFAEAAEDAEERRAEADRRAAEAKQRALEAKQRERAVIRLIDDILKTSPSGKEEACQSPEANDSLEDWNGSNSPNAFEADKLSLSPSARPNVSTPKQADAVDSVSRSPTNRLPKDARGSKRILFEISNGQDENTSIPSCRTGSVKCVERSKPLGENCKVGRIRSLKPQEKENFNLVEAEAGVSIEQAAQLDDAVVKHLVELIIIVRENLVKAEAEGDFIHAKYCKLRRLLMDTLVTFGILPEFSMERGLVQEILLQRFES